MALILLGWGAVAGGEEAAPDPPLAERLMVMRERFEESMQAFQARIEPITDPQARAELYRARPDPGPIVHQMVELGLASPGDPALLEHAPWIIRIAPPGHDLTPLGDALTEQFLDHDGLADACMACAYRRDPGVDALLTRAMQSDRPVVQAASLFARAEREAQQPSPGSRERQEALLEKLVADFEGVEFHGRVLAESAAGTLFALRHLAIGKFAPEIEGEDSRGERFKLSDYRGQVVMLDFWGDW